ncbi:MAG: YceI family protein [Bacteroidota bacterium]
MYKNLFLFGLLLFALPFLSHGQTINTAESKVTFKVSNMAFRTVDGSFTGMNGTVDFTTADLSNSNFEVCVDANTVNTDNKKRDDHLRKDDFFHVEKYPTICFQSQEIKQSDTGFTTKGALTMHGVSKEVEIPFTFENNQFTGQLTVDRLDYKVGEGTGGFMVGKEIEITIICVVE